MYPSQKGQTGLASGTATEIQRPPLARSCLAPLRVSGGSVERGTPLNGLERRRWHRPSNKKEPLDRSSLWTPSKNF